MYNLVRIQMNKFIFTREAIELSYLQEQPFLPIVIQSGQHAYGVARSFYEAYHIKSLVIEPARERGNFRSLFSGGAQGIATQNSGILEFQYVEHLDDPHYFVQALQMLAKQFQHQRLILLVCDCFYAELIIQNKEELEKYFILPYIDQALLKKVQTKEKFYQLCDLYKLKYPQTVTVTKEQQTNYFIPFHYPIIIKPSNSVAYSSCSFPEKKKIYLAHNDSEVQKIVHCIYRSSYQDSLILQEFIPGDDSFIRVLDVYVGRDKTVKLMCLSNKLFEDPSPQNKGISLAVMTDYDEQLMDTIRHLLEDIGYTGFANFDMKYDPRDGEYKIFELNLRAGSSSYYVTASGHNYMQYVVDDYLFHIPLERTYVQTKHLWSLLPPRTLYKCMGNEKLKMEAKRLVKQGQYTNALFYKEDMSMKRWIKLKLYDGYLYIKHRKYFINRDV